MADQTPAQNRISKLESARDAWKSSLDTYQYEYTQTKTEYQQRLAELQSMPEGEAKRSKIKRLQKETNERLRYLSANIRKASDNVSDYREAIAKSRRTGTYTGPRDVRATQSKVQYKEEKARQAAAEAAATPETEQTASTKAPTTYMGTYYRAPAQKDIYKLQVGGRTYLTSDVTDTPGRQSFASKKIEEAELARQAGMARAAAKPGEPVYFEITQQGIDPKIFTLREGRKVQTGQEISGEFKQYATKQYSAAVEQEAALKLPSAQKSLTIEQQERQANKELALAHFRERSKEKKGPPKTMEALGTGPYYTTNQYEEDKSASFWKGVRQGFQPGKYSYPFEQSASGQIGYGSGLVGLGISLYGAVRFVGPIYRAVSAPFRYTEKAVDYGLGRIPGIRRYSNFPILQLAEYGAVGLAETAAIYKGSQYAVKKLNPQLYSAVTSVEYTEAATAGRAAQFEALSYEKAGVGGVVSKHVINTFGTLGENVVGRIGLPTGLSESQQAFEESIAAQGLTGKQRQQFIEYRKSYRKVQTATDVFVALNIERLSENLGRNLVIRGFSKRYPTLVTTKALPETLRGVVGKPLLYAGALEGSLQAFGQQVQTGEYKPLELAGYGALGAVSAYTLGVPIAATRSATKRLGLETVGSVLDLMEKPGDWLTDVQRSVAVRTGFIPNVAPDIIVKGKGALLSIKTATGGASVPGVSPSKAKLSGKGAQGPSFAGFTSPQPSSKWVTIAPGVQSLVPIPTSTRSIAQSFGGKVTAPSNIRIPSTLRSDLPAISNVPSEVGFPAPSNVPAEITSNINNFVQVPTNVPSQVTNQVPSNVPTNVFTPDFPLWFPFGGSPITKGRRRGRGRAGSFSASYVPSLTSITFGITTTAKKGARATFFDIRPIVVGKKRGGKKRRRR